MAWIGTHLFFSWITESDFSWPFKTPLSLFYFAIVVYTGKESKVYAFDSPSVFLLLKAYITV